MLNPQQLNQQPVQPDNALLGIRIAMSLSFVILMTIGYFAARKFVLTNERSLKVRKFLKIREETGLENLSVDDQMELMKLESEIF